MLNPSSAQAFLVSSLRVVPIVVSIVVVPVAVVVVPVPVMSRLIVRPIPVIPVAIVVVVLEPTPSTTSAVVAPISTATTVIVTVLPRLQHGRWRRRLGAVRLELGVVLGEAVLELLLALVQKQLVLLGQDVDFAIRVDHFRLV